MAIIFHEGYPRSGKSYETVVYWIIPQLMQGRKIFAYVEGLNHSKISEITGIPLAIVQSQLVQLTAEQVPEIYKYVEKDSLVVIDELQNFFPSGRQKLSDEITRFVAEHGHDGHDIVCMGQSLHDCHNLWKRRIIRKTLFIKREGVGKENSYKWILYNGMIDGKGNTRWQEANSGKKDYDPKYFGTYKSHTSGTTNTGNMTDARANILNNLLFRRVLPVSLVAGVVAVVYLVSFFTPDAEIVEAGIKSEIESDAQAFDEWDKTHQLKAMPAPVVPVKPPKEFDYITDVLRGNKIRLSGLLEYQRDGVTQYKGRVEVVDSTFHQKEIFTLVDLESLGWTIQYKPFGLLISKTGQDDIVVRPWPIDSTGKTSSHNLRNPSLHTALTP